MAKAAIPWQDRLIPEPNSGCWLWEGSTVGLGYGIIHKGRTHALVHRLAWEEANGPIPDGLFVLHTCDVPACANPAHLWLGTKADNARDRAAKGRGTLGERLTPRFQCSAGHPYTEENSGPKQGGYFRFCRECKRLASARYRARKAERVP